MTKAFLAGLSVLAIVVAAAATPATAAERVAVNGVWMDAAAAAAVPAAAPESLSQGPNWGGSTNMVYNIGACDFALRDTTHTAQSFNCTRVDAIPTATSTSIGFPVHLPSGAAITSVKMNYFDNDPASPSVGFYRIDATGALGASLTSFAPPVFTGGVNSITSPVSHTVNNLGASYQILAILSRGSAATSVGIISFEINWHLQVSPGPAVATFPSDVPTSHPFFRFVEALAASGLTGGCASGQFCPDTPVTRGQLAVFLAIALGLNFQN